MERIGRNDPCPCGSGRKFKKCCGVGGAPRPVAAAPHDGRYLRFHVQLQTPPPHVWRRFLLRADATFADLHAAIQSLGWTGSHLWHFVDPDSGAVIAGIPHAPMFGDPEPDAQRVALRSWFRSPGQQCVYVYDFGDDWRHAVRLEGIEQHDARFERALLDGAGAFPPEDCGGLPGFERLREHAATGIDPWDDPDSLLDVDLEEFDPDLERRRFGAPVVAGGAPAAETPTAGKPAAEALEPAAGLDQPARITAIDAQVMSTILGGLDAAARRLGEELGLRIEVRRGRYRAANARIDIEVATVREDGIVMDKLASDFQHRCDEFGLEPADLGREFELDDLLLRVVGLRPRANEPVVCEQLEPAASPPQRMRLPAATVRAGLRRAAKSRPRSGRPAADPEQRAPHQLRLLDDDPGLDAGDA